MESFGPSEGRHPTGRHPQLVRAGKTSVRPARGLEDLAQRIVAFHARFHGFFVVRTRNVIAQSKNYLLGLIQSEKRNMERMAEVVPESDEQVLQHFLSNSNL